MDKVKAIKVLKPLVDSYVDYANISMKEEDDNIVEALEMAIEALKALDVPDTNVGDMISRQMAIDTIMGQPPEPHYPSWYAAQIEKLPAAQPEQVCVANVTLTDEQVKEVVEKAKNAVISVIELEPHWIPCSKRLPEKMGYYLISNEYKVVHEDYYWGGGCFEKAKKYQCEVVAWMPMPIPPYCGGNEE